MDWNTLLHEWPMARPRMLRPIDAGSNNLSHYVETPDATYYLRVYQNAAGPARLCYEHALLCALGEAGLPFAVPVPIPARSGETYVAVSGAGNVSWAALFPLIPGRHPRIDDPAHLHACGAALGELDRALATITVDLPAASHYDDLRRVHPLVPDPLEVPRGLSLDRAQEERLAGLFAMVLDASPRLQATLPRQVIHADFDGRNVLLEGDRVSGVLDFEFAGPSVRALDFAIALYGFTRPGWESKTDWTPLELFARGYAAQCALSGHEVAALPALMRLHRAASLLHRVGRRRHGYGDDGGLVRRAREMLWVDDWLSAHGAELIQRIAC